MRYPHLRNAVARNTESVIQLPSRIFERGHHQNRHQDGCPRTLDFLAALIQSICLVTRLHSLHDRVLQLIISHRNIHYRLNHLDVSPTTGTKPAQAPK